MEVKAINYLDKEFDYDDFIISGEIYIGPENEDYVYDVFEFNVISIKLLYSTILIWITNCEKKVANQVIGVIFYKIILCVVLIFRILNG